MVKRFQAAVATVPSGHGTDEVLRDVQVFRVKRTSKKRLRFERVPYAKLLASKSKPAPSREDREETSPELMAQIREGREAYLQGNVRPFDDFIAELENELRDEVRE